MFDDGDSAGSASDCEDACMLGPDKASHTGPHLVFWSMLAGICVCVVACAFPDSVLNASPHS